jgi:hypothetical protein
VTWKKSFLADNVWDLLDGKGVRIGSVVRTSGSWDCKYGLQSIAIRPDRESARACVEKYHEAVELDKLKRGRNPRFAR